MLKKTKGEKGEESVWSEWVRERKTLGFEDFQWNNWKSFQRGKNVVQDGF